VYALPPIPDMPGGEVPRRATQAAINANATSFIYLSTGGLYGATASSDWIDEQSATALDDPGMAGYLAEEAAISAATAAGLRTVILRLPAVYGPGRGVRARLRKGDYTIVDDGTHWFSRIHVEDLVQVIFAADDKAPPGSIYLVSDDKPTQQKEHATWIAEHLRMPVPRSIPSFAPGTARTAIRGRRVKNELMKKELGVTLKYPTFVEGELQIDAEEGGLESTQQIIAVPRPTAPAATAAAPAAAPPAAPAAASGSTRPEHVRHVSELSTEWNGVRVVVVPPGQRYTAGAVVYLVEGTADVDGYRLRPGDLVAKGDIVNSGSTDVRLFTRR
jgi:hypothetical protein